MTGKLQILQSHIRVLFIYTIAMLVYSGRQRRTQNQQVKAIKLTISGIRTRSRPLRLPLVWSFAVCSVISVFAPKAMATVMIVPASDPDSFPVQWVNNGGTNQLQITVSPGLSKAGFAIYDTGPNNNLQPDRSLAAYSLSLSVVAE